MEFEDGAKFVHICENETIGGVGLKNAGWVTDPLVLVADAPPNYLSTDRRTSTEYSVGKRT